MSNKYKVAEGYSFVANGKTYDAGEEIPEEIFSDKKVFSSMLSQKKIVAADGFVVSIKEATDPEVQAKKPEAKVEKPAEEKATKKAKE